MIFLEPAVEEEKPGFLGFAREDEGLGAGAVFGGIFGGGGAAFGRGGAGAAAVAFFLFGLFGLALLGGSGRIVEKFGVVHCFLS